jgi:DNA cross-link repair 1A protein
LATHVHACLEPNPKRMKNNFNEIKQEKHHDLEIIKSKTTPTISTFAIFPEEATMMVAAQATLLQNNQKKKSCPWYKILKPFAVDAFCYGTVPNITGYILTHFHSDHYMGLSSKWNSGMIYCSKVTARLVEIQLKVDSKFIQPLPMGKSVVQGVDFELIDAFHCPGAVLILLTFPPGPESMLPRRVLHTGDFRAHPMHWTHPSLTFKKIDRCYLDTTYCKPSHSFPSQDLILDMIAKIAKKIYFEGLPPQDVFADSKPLRSFFLGNQAYSGNVGKTLFVVGSYLIGKEKVFKTIANAIDSKIYTVPRKALIYRALQDPEIDQRLTSDPHEAMVHVVPMGHLNDEVFSAILEKHPKATQIVAFRPTGWTFSKQKQSKAFKISTLKPVYLVNTKAMTVVPVPYSEHSSYEELEAFCTHLTIDRIIPTVNLNDIKEMDSYFKSWKTKDRKLSLV